MQYLISITGLIEQFLMNLHLTTAKVTDRHAIGIY